MTYTSPATVVKKIARRAIQASGVLRSEQLAKVTSLRRAKPVLRAIDRDPELSRIQAGSYYQMPFGLVTKPIRQFPSLLRKSSPYEHNAQRPDFYLPGLEAKPWWPADAISKVLIDNLPIIKEEFENISSRVIGHPQKDLLNAGNWLTFPFYRSGRIDDNCLSCPKTAEIIESLPLCHELEGLAYFSVMQPGTKIKPHCGPVNTRIRYHLTLSSDEQAWMRVGDEERHWKNGECLVFDDSFEHEVQHHGGVPRVVLLVDCWHPDLSALEREWLTRLYAQIAKPHPSA